MPVRAPYPCFVSCLRRFGRNQALLGVAAVVALLSIIGAALFTNAYVHVVREGFRERSLAYAQAFAASAGAWVNREDLGMLRSAAQLVLAGSALYVQIADEEGLIVDERMAVAEEMPIAWGEASSTPSVERVKHVGGTHLDVRVPLPSLTGEIDGYVRIGIDRATVAAQSTGAIATAAAATVGFNLLLAALIFFALHWEPTATGLGDPSAPTVPDEGIVTVGSLRISTARKTVHVEDSEVSLTPKQFALLELLASRPGHVFSEREILAAAWPESPYADSKDIKQYVYLVRQRLSKVDEEARRLIETVPGFGYRLATDDVDPELTR